MSARDWAAVDEYIGEKLVKQDKLMSDVLAANAEAGLPAIDVSEAQGKFLQLLVHITKARRILEVGTLGGYSTIWMGRGLPVDGELVTLEFVPAHAEVARRNIERAGLSGHITVHVGKAAETLPKLAARNAEPFDFVFIDADKPSNTIYLDWAIKLSRPGTVIVLDNVVRDGQVVNAQSQDANVLGSRAAFDLISNHPRLSATALQTDGSKGWDGFAVMVVN